MTFVQAIWLAVLQGVSELFPVSSLGHTVIVPRLVGWNLDQESPTFLPFLVMLHLGTATALLCFFWRDWWQLITAWVRSVIRGRMSDDPDEHLAWMVIVGTIPTGVIGLFLQTPLKHLFASPVIAAAFLVVNGIVMLFGEWLRRRQLNMGDTAAGKGVESLTWRSAATIGLAQSSALIPGISRSGSTIVAGLLTQLSHEAAARFSFLLATPIILAAGLLEVPKLLGPSGQSMLGVSVVGGVVAGVTAFFSVKFLMRYFEFGRLDPFAYYCIAFGVLALVLLTR